MFDIFGINKFIEATRDTAFAKACVNAYELDAIATKLTYEMVKPIVKPVVKYGVPLVFACYVGAIGLDHGHEWLVENTEFGKKIEQLENRMSASDFYEGWSKACNAVNAMRD